MCRNKRGYFKNFYRLTVKRIMVTKIYFYDKLVKMKSNFYISEAGYGSNWQYGKKAGEPFRFKQ